MPGDRVHLANVMRRVRTNPDVMRIARERPSEEGHHRHDGGMRIERKELDQGGDSQLRNVQVGADQRLQLDGGCANGDAVACPRMCASALPESAHRRR